ncbi:MAG: BLUF domain-containing protein [Casimicrobium sp.]
MSVSKSSAHEFMIRLVYVSTCAPGLKLDDVYAIMRAADPHNVEQGISGMLCWSGEFFLQCLEGERAQVSRLFAKICGDTRHTDIEILIAAPTNVRWFGEWGMGFSRLLASHQLDLPSGTMTGFNPYLLQASDLESTFEQLSQVAQRLAIS